MARRPRADMMRAMSTRGPADRDTADGQRRGGERGVGQPHYALPSDLAGSLRRLDDGQLDRLMRAVADEARRRGRPVDAGGVCPPAPAPDKASGLPAATAAIGKTKKRAGSIPPGQEKVIRAAFEAGVKPGTIARQFRLSRAQVEQVVGSPKRRRR